MHLGRTGRHGSGQRDDFLNLIPRPGPPAAGARPVKDSEEYARCMLYK